MNRASLLRRRHFACKFLFLAAGSMGTSALLVRAKAKGTLPRLNRFVGQEWASNGDFFLSFVLVYRSPIPGREGLEVIFLWKTSIILSAQQG